MMNSHLLGVICESDTSVSMSSISSVHLLRKALSELRLFVLVWPQFSSNTIVQRLPRLETQRAVWKRWTCVRDAAYVLTGT